MKNIKTDSFTEEEALQITADTLERLFLKGINTLRLTTDDDELLIVHVHSEGKIEEEAVDEEKAIEELDKDE